MAEIGMAAACCARGMEMQDIGVVYLYRFAEGESPVQRFLQSYNAHPAGIDHDLNVIFKGFPDSASLSRARALFGPPINPIEQADVAFDVGSYAYAANAVSNRRLLFLNTFSQILSDNWLRLFDEALNLPGIGLVGATGSWQSNTAGLEAALKRLIRGNWNREVDKPTDAEFSFLLRWWLQTGRAIDAPLLRLRSAARRRALFLAPFRYAYGLYEYGRYPNPHIRTNAFMIDREQFISLSFPRFTKKTNVYKFESGRYSMTKQILGRNLKPVVVGRDGRVYSIAEWKSSSTYWVNGQPNLIIADNRTADYDKAAGPLRRKFENFAWIHPWDWQGQ